MQDLRGKTLFYCAIALMVSLFLSRIALSVGIAVFVIISFAHQDIKGQFNHFLSSPLLWGMSLLFFLPLLSGLWSSDSEEWLRSMRIHLPLLILPLAFAAPFTFTGRQWRILGFTFLLLTVAGSAWSLFRYFTDMTAIHAGYLRAQSLPTPLENDHVRFSWLTAVAALFSGWLLWKYKGRRIARWLLFAAFIWLVIFLHILAARTGLLVLYAALFAAVVHYAFKTNSMKRGLGMIVLLLALPVAAYFLFPTLRNKAKYFYYDLGYFKDAHYLPGGNDALRVISWKAGIGITEKYPIRGAGFGDLRAEAEDWYVAHYPEVWPAERILPSSEWLIFGAGCGVPGLLLFSFVMVLPFLIKVSNRKNWYLLNGMVAIGFLFDIGLEVQYGVFIYSFIVPMAWKWFRSEA